MENSTIQAVVEFPLENVRSKDYYKNLDREG